MSQRPRLLLHVCCGPCATAVLERLVKDHAVTCLWHNPNIRPAEEWTRRLETARQVMERYGVEMLQAPNDVEAWETVTAGLEEEPEGGERCRRCIRLRLERTGEEARRGGYDLFATTLSISPHKDAEAINHTGRELGEAVGVHFLGADFKKGGGFGRSVELSRELGLYRQTYCGCGATGSLPSRAQ